MQRNLVIAFVEDHPRAIRILRMARRRAQMMGGRWRAVYVETPAQLQTAGSKERMLRLLTLGEQMGGETTHITADSLEKGMAGLLEEENERLALFILGSMESDNHISRLLRLPWKRVAAMAERYADVEVVPLSDIRYRKTLRERFLLQGFRARSLLYAIMAVATAFLFALALQWALPPALFRINIQNVGLLFMIACAFTAGRYGLLPGLVASVASFLAVNYYFATPYYEMSLINITDLINMLLFLMAAVLISVFTSRNRKYAENAARRERSAQALFTLYRLASSASSRQQVLERLQHKLTHMLEMDIAFFLPATSNRKHIVPSLTSDIFMEEADRMALEICWKEMKTTGLAAPFNPGTRWRFEPMIAPGGEMGVLGVRPRKPVAIDAWFGGLLTTIADQTASIIERIELERSVEATRIREEREKLRSMLLSSVSHDLKTPLAGIIGALGVYRSLKDRLAPAKRDDLLETALSEAQRLDSLITNILDMTQLEKGGIELRPEWHDMQSLLHDIAKRLRHRLSNHVLSIQPYSMPVEVYMDVMMTEQVLQNIVDNACKHTPPGTRIEIGCNVDDEKGFLCEVRDFGPGVPEEMLDRIFDKYERLHKTDKQVAGTGLGLAIARSVMEAQGGWITATNAQDGGLSFILCFPKWRKLESDRCVA